MALSSQNQNARDGGDDGTGILKAALPACARRRRRRKKKGAKVKSLRVLKLPPPSKSPSNESHFSKPRERGILLLLPKPHRRRRERVNNGRGKVILDDKQISSARSLEANAEEGNQKNLVFRSWKKRNGFALIMEWSPSVRMAQGEMAEWQICTHKHTDKSCPRASRQRPVVAKQTTVL